MTALAPVVAVDKAKGYTHAVVSFRSVHRGLQRHYDKPYELMPAMQTNIALHLVTGLLLVAGYVIDNVLG